MKELWHLVLILLMLGVLAGFASMSTPTGAFAVNLPPQWDYPTTEFMVDDRLELNLDKAFFDPDGDPLSFSVTPGAGTTAGVYGDKIVVMGTGEVTISASDGQDLVSKKITIAHK